MISAISADSPACMLRNGIKSFTEVDSLPLLLLIISLNKLIDPASKIKR